MVRREFLRNLAGSSFGLAVAGSMVGSAHFFRAASASSTTTLKQIAAAKGLLYGSLVKANCLAATPEEVEAIGLPADRFFLPSNASYTEMVARECNLVVDDGGDIQWGIVAPTPDKTLFKRAEFAYHWAHSHGTKFGGHALVSHEAVPKWFMGLPDREAAVKALLDHVRLLCSHFAGNIQSWDVVNEVFRTEQGRPDGLDPGNFVDKIGPEYLDIAFSAAREADPNALLVHNEHNLDYDNPTQELNRKSFIKLLDGYKKRKTPIDAVGIQAHLRIAENGALNDRVLAEFLQEISGRGLKILITELDVVDRGAPGDIPKRDAEVAALYKRYLDVVLSNKATIAVINWGLCDLDSWIYCEDKNCYENKYTRRDDDLPPRPLLFDADYQPKPAYFAIAEAIKSAPSRV
jgi:endo-1,4-beta-xylanase